jgi:RNA polymerase sigma-70 factor (ECF subfamily)
MAGRRVIAAAGMEEMFREHWSLVLGYLTTRVRDRGLAEDLAAETFYRATRAFLGWRGESPPAWLLAIARNVLVDAARRDRRHAQLDEGVVGPVEHLEDDAAVRTALGRLPEAQRRLLVLVHVYGYSCPEVAAMSDTTPGAVRMALSRARAAAREELT